MISPTEFGSWPEIAAKKLGKSLYGMTVRDMPMKPSMIAMISPLTIFSLIMHLAKKGIIRVFVKKIHRALLYEVY